MNILFESRVFLLLLFIVAAGRGSRLLRLLAVGQLYYRHVFHSTRLYLAYRSLVLVLGF
jgi:hypothetical protein